MPDTILRPYTVGNAPSLPDSDRRYLADELLRISQSIGLLVDAIASPWTEYTPTVDFVSGAATAIGRYKQIGKTVHLNLRITITSDGSWPNISLPDGMSTASVSILQGREIAVTGYEVMGHTQGTATILIKYDNTSSLTAGEVYILNGTFEVA